MSYADELHRRGVAKRKHPERDIQRGIVALVRRCYPSVLIAAIPNEQAGASGDAEARARFGAARKASGVLSGHPDLILYLPGGRTLLLEVKAAAGRVSEAQASLHARLWDMGHPVHVVRSIEDAQAALTRTGAAQEPRFRMAVPVEPLAR